ncbi:hypothetical protein V1520DRAFT_27231 [Lipomyces starkeyi]|uniref:Uncharacterized protein n=1 Tax=Lipomyces starkeyi NRRL Y-11557 TaxID=675824 RepID=A0A1E3QB73_LIPST|nr:hypothetical protein LIPSTDRAFT_61801 [Lipomyces starkeyi NRRL Y-11557]
MPAKRDNIRELQIFEGASLKRWTPGSFVASTLASRAGITTALFPSAGSHIKDPTSVNNRQTGKQRSYRKHVKNKDDGQEWSAEEISSLNIFERFVDGNRNAERMGKINVVHQRLAEILFPGRPYSEIFDRLKSYRLDVTAQPASHDRKRRKVSSKLQELRHIAETDTEFLSRTSELNIADDDNGEANKKTWAEKMEEIDGILGLNFADTPSQGVADTDSTSKVAQAEAGEVKNRLLAFDRLRDTGRDIEEPSEVFSARERSTRVHHLDEVLGLGDFAMEMQQAD